MLCSRGLATGEGSEKEDVNDHRRDAGDEISELRYAATADTPDAVGTGWVAATINMEQLHVFSFLVFDNG